MASIEWTAGAAGSGSLMAGCYTLGRGGRSAELHLDLDGDRPLDGVAHGAVGHAPLDDATDLVVWCGWRGSDVDPHRQRPGGDRWVEAEDPVIVRLAVDRHLELVEVDALLGGPHRDQRGDAGRVGGPEQP